MEVPTFCPIVFPCAAPAIAQLTILQAACIITGLPGGASGKESACNAEDPGSIPGLGRSPEEENGYPLQYSCLENSMDRGAWWARVHGVAKGQTQLSN